MAPNKFSGKERFLRRMRQIPLAARIAARDQMRTEAFRLAEHIKAAAPVVEGDLRESVRAVDVAEGQTTAASDKIAMQVRAGDGLPAGYALRVEFGTPEQSESAFFYPTYRARRRGIKLRMTRAIRKAIGNIWGKGGK